MSLMTCITLYWLLPSRAGKFPCNLLQIAGSNKACTTQLMEETFVHNRLATCTGYKLAPNELQHTCTRSG